MTDLNIARNIRAKRSAANLSGKELAAKLGVSPAYISYLERGKRQPSVSLLEKLSQVLGCRIGELVDGEEALPNGRTA